MLVFVKIFTLGKIAFGRLLTLGKSLWQTLLVVCGSDTNDRYCTLLAIKAKTTNTTTNSLISRIIKLTCFLMTFLVVVVLYVQSLIQRSQTCFPLRATLTRSLWLTATLLLFYISVIDRLRDRCYILCRLTHSQSNANTLQTLLSKFEK